MRCLLDKVTARRILEAFLKLSEQRDVSRDEAFTLDLYGRAGIEGIELFIVPSTDRVLQRLADYPRYSALIHHFRQRTIVLWPTRYYKRWARRLREQGFTPEDASVLALGTFGTRSEADIIGVHVITTLDQPMIRQWTTQETVIRSRLASMQRELPSPYHHAPLPQVLRPEQVG